nr:hypothetical protein CFP56_70150 [Quercus suber]
MEQKNRPGQSGQWLSCKNERDDGTSDGQGSQQQYRVVWIGLSACARRDEGGPCTPPPALKGWDLSTTTLTAAPSWRTSSFEVSASVPYACSSILSGLM